MLPISSLLTLRIIRYFEYLNMIDFGFTSVLGATFEGNEKGKKKNLGLALSSKKASVNMHGR